MFNAVSAAISRHSGLKEEGMTSKKVWITAPREGTRAETTGGCP